MAVGEPVGLLLSLTVGASGDSGPGTGNYMLLLALTSEHSAAPLDTTGQTVLMPGGRSFSKKDWRALTALIAAEQAAQEKALESPQAQEALSPAIEATECVIAALPLLDDDDGIPDLGEVTRALQAVVSARGPNLAALAEEAAAIARHVEIAVYERMEAEEAADERLVMMILDEERQAFGRKIDSYIRKLKRRR